VVIQTQSLVLFQYLNWKPKPRVFPETFPETVHCQNPGFMCCNQHSLHHVLQLLQPFTALWTSSGTTRVSQYQKKHSPTHTHRGHQSSLICFLHLLRSTASSLFNICAWQSFYTISLQVFFGLPLGWELHTPNISSPNHCLLFATHNHTITTCFAAVPKLCHLILVSLSTLYLELCLYWPFSSLPAEVPPYFPFKWARSHFHATYYFAHNYCTISLSLSTTYPYW